MSLLRPCAVALLALTLIACPAAKPKPDVLKPIPKLQIAPDLEPDFAASDTVVIFRMKAGPWTGLQPLIDRVGNLPIPFTIRAALKALAEKGPIGALVVLEGNPPPEIQKALDMIDRSGDIFVRFALSTSPANIRMVDADNAMLTSEQYNQFSTSTSIYIPTKTPKDLVEVFKTGLGTRASNQYEALQTYAVLRNATGRLQPAAPKLPLRATPAALDFFNTPAMASAYVRPRQLRDASMKHGLGQMGDALRSVVSEQAGRMMVYGLGEVLEVPSLMGAERAEFEDHSFSLRAAGKDSVVIDAVATRTDVGRAVFKTISTGAATALPSIPLTEEQQQNLLLSSEGAMNLPALLDELRASGALPKPTSLRRLARAYSRSGYGGTAIAAASPAHLMARVFHESKQLRDTPILAGRVRLWKNVVTGSLPGLAAVFAFRGDQAAADKLVAFASKELGPGFRDSASITAKARPDGTFVVMLATKDAPAFGADTPATKATATLDVDFKNFPAGVFPISPAFLGELRGELLPNLGASYARLEFVGAAAQPMKPTSWAFTPAKAAGIPCRTKLSRATLAMVKALREPTFTRTPLDDVDKEIAACSSADAANAATYKAVGANARWLYGVQYETRGDKTTANPFYKEACDMGAKEACEDLKRGRWSPIAPPADPPAPPQP